MSCGDAPNAAGTHEKQTWPTPIATTSSWLTRQGALVEVMVQTYLTRMLTLRGAMLRKDPACQPLCADIAGFSLHAAVRVEAHDRKRLERLR